MSFLLDTQILLWFLADDPRLSARHRALVTRKQGRLLLSVASIWEISVKHSIGKLPLVEPPEQLIPPELVRHEIEVLPIVAAHAYEVGRLPWHHRDPFDRLIVAQCRVESLALVSADEAMDAYEVRRG